MVYNSQESQERFLSLPEEDRNFLKDHKHHASAIKLQIADILFYDHPKTVSLYKWINANNNNKKWYLKNINKIKLVPEGIEIFWNIYDIEDITNPEAYSLSIIDSKRWQRVDAEKYIQSIWKEIPDWIALVQLFPSDIWQSFFIDVMGMSRLYLSTSSRSLSTSKDTLTFGTALSSVGKLRGVIVKK